MFVVLSVTDPMIGDGTDQPETLGECADGFAGMYDQLLNAKPRPATQQEPFKFDHLLLCGRLTSNQSPGQYDRLRAAGAAICGRRSQRGTEARTLFLSPGEGDAKGEGWASAFEKWVKESGNVVVDGSKCCWLQATTGGVLLGHAPGVNPDEAVRFFETQLNENYSYFRSRPILFVGEPTIATLLTKALATKLTRLDLLTLGPTEWSMHDTASGWRVTTALPQAMGKTEMWPQLWGIIMVAGSSGRPCAVGRKLDPNAEWSVSLAPEVAFRRPKLVARGQGELYQPFVHRLYQKLKVTSGPRLVIVHGFPGVGKKYLYSHLVASGAGGGGPIPGWGQADEKQHVVVQSFDIETKDDYDQCIGVAKPAASGPLRDVVERVYAAAQKENTVGVLTIYDHLKDPEDVGFPEASPDDSNVAGGGVLPDQIKRKLEGLRALRDLFRNGPWVNGRPWYIIYFSANFWIGERRFELGRLGETAEHSLIGELRLTGDLDVLEHLHAQHSCYVPVSLNAVRGVSGDFIKFSDKLLIESRITYARDHGGSGLVNGPTHLANAWSGSQWLQHEARWLRRALARLLASDTQLAEAIEQVGKLPRDRQDTGDEHLQQLLGEDCPIRRRSIDKLRAYGILSGPDDDLRLLPVLYQPA